MAMFNASEIYQFAIKIEENGEKFYRTMTDRLSDEKVKELFTHLANEEVNHKKTFQAMLAKFQNYEPVENYPGEYFDYLKAYAENLVFNFNKFDHDISGIQDAASAVQFAIGKELDTIMYFQEMKNIAPVSESERIEAIINEERKHVVKLAEIKRQI